MSAQELTERLRRSMQDSSNMMMIIFMVILFTVYLLYIYRKISLRKKNCKRLDAIKEDIDENYNSYLDFNTMINDGAFVHVDASSGDTYNYQLRDYYIKTAYNACCSGKFKNDYVDLCALQIPNAYGVRALDFQIYSLKDQPIVAASTTTSHNYKESINHLNLSDVLYEVNNIFLENNQYGMGSHPLFLIFRMHTTNPNVYEKMASLLGEYFNTTRFLRYNSSKPYDEHSYDIPRTNMADLERKVVILLLFIVKPVTIMLKSHHLENLSIYTVQV